MSEPEYSYETPQTEPVATPVAATNTVKVYRPEDSNRLMLDVPVDDLAEWTTNGWKAAE